MIDNMPEKKRFEDLKRRAEDREELRFWMSVTCRMAEKDKLELQKIIMSLTFILQTWLMFLPCHNLPPLPFISHTIHKSTDPHFLRYLLHLGIYFVANVSPESRIVLILYLFNSFSNMCDFLQRVDKTKNAICWIARIACFILVACDISEISFWR